MNRPILLGASIAPNRCSLNGSAWWVPARDGRHLAVDGFSGPTRWTLVTIADQARRSGYRVKVLADEPSWWYEQGFSADVFWHDTPMGDEVDQLAALTDELGDRDLVIVDVAEPDESPRWADTKRLLRRVLDGPAMVAVSLGMEWPEWCILGDFLIRVSAGVRAEHGNPLKMSSMLHPEVLFPHWTAADEFPAPVFGGPPITPEAALEWGSPWERYRENPERFRKNRGLEPKEGRCVYVDRIEQGSGDLVLLLDPPTVPAFWGQSFDFYAQDGLV